MDTVNIESLAVFGFACVIAWRLLSFFLNVFAKKLDCIKDTLIQVLAEMRDIKTRLPAREE
jgi:hypothetical protein